MKINLLTAVMLLLLMASCQNYDDTGLNDNRLAPVSIELDASDALQGKINKLPCNNRQAMTWEGLAAELTRVANCNRDLPPFCQEGENYLEPIDAADMPVLLSFCETFSPGSCPDCTGIPNSFSITEQNLLIDQALTAALAQLEVCGDEFLFLEFETISGNCPIGAPSCHDFCWELRVSAVSHCCVFVVGF